MATAAATTCRRRRRLFIFFLLGCRKRWVPGSSNPGALFISVENTFLCLLSILQNVVIAKIGSLIILMVYCGKVNFDDWVTV